MSYAIQVWIYECCMQLPLTLAVRHANIIPRILNWRVIDPMPKFNTIMESIFINTGNRVSFSNISPSPTELAVYDLTHVSDITPNQVVISVVPDGFEDFTTPPPSNVYMVSNLSGSSSAQPHKKQKFDGTSHAAKFDNHDMCSHTPETVISEGKEPLISSVFDNPHKSAEKECTTSYHELTHNIQVQSPQSKNTEEDYSSSQKEFSLLRKDINNLKDMVEKQFVDLRMYMQDMFKVIFDTIKEKKNMEYKGPGSAIQSSDGDGSHNNAVPHNTHGEGNGSGDTKKATTEEVQGVHVSKELHESDKDVPVASNYIPIRNSKVRKSTSQEQDQLESICVLPLSAVPSDTNTNFEFFISDSAFPSQISETKIVVRTSTVFTETPVQSNRLPGRWNKSPYVTEFGSGSGTKVVSDTFSQIHPFQSYFIVGPHPFELFQEYSVWLQAGLLKIHANKKTKDEHYRKKDCDLDQHLDFVVAFAKTKNWFYTMSVAGNYWNAEHMDVIFYYLRKKSKFQSNGNPRYTTAMCHFKSLMDEIYHTYKAQVPGQNAFTQGNSICSYINGFGTPAGIPWDQVDEVYIPVNCKEEFHWVLAVVQLKDRCIRVYDSHVVAGHNSLIKADIAKIAFLLPSYLTLSGFFDKSERVDWLNLEEYNGKTVQDAFEIIFQSNIVQQSSGSMDCGLYSAAYAEYLTDGQSIPLTNFDVNLHRSRYGALLWNYGNQKASSGSVSDNEDPHKPRNTFVDSDGIEKINID
uniref:Ulp1 protease family, C-terminal catalytic domain containing protein n=1 Tax=Solanum tuberosum TaxID=4113 RepID=M1C4R9_SOLTU